MLAIAVLDVWLIPRYGLIAAALTSSVVYGCQAAYWVRCLTRVSGMKTSDLLLVTPEDLRILA